MKKSMMKKGKLYLPNKKNLDLVIMKSINVCVNLNKIERKIIELILNKSILMAEKLSIKINKTKRIAKIYLKLKCFACYLKVVKYI